MEKYIGTSKPLISIIMAIYEPNLEWLMEQLASLNAQTYPNLKLYIMDDCSHVVSYEEIRICVESSIHAFPYVLWRGEKRVGSNRVFEALTRVAEGEYFAYCDQDDVWLPEKLEILQKEMEASEVTLVCSDMYVIDQNGRIVADSLTKVRKHHRFRSGSGLAPGLLFSNFATGCTMLVRSDAVKAAIPFCPYMVHDHYIALWCAEHGKVIALPRPLIRYRIHGGNQSLSMAGVTDKQSYEKVRIELSLCRMSWLAENFCCCKVTGRAIRDGLLWMQARKKNWRHMGGKSDIWKFRRFSLLTSLFEIFAASLPDKVFYWFITLERRNIL